MGERDEGLADREGIVRDDGLIEEDPPEFGTHELASLGRLDVGDLLSTTFKVVTANLPAFLLVGAVIVAPFALLEVLADSIVAALIGWFANYLMQAVVVFATVQHMAGREVSMSAAVNKGLGRLLPVVAAAFLVGLVVGVGFILCIIPGVIAQCMFLLAITVVVAENLGPIEAMKRSAHLTEGNRMRLFGGILVLFLILIFVGAPIVVAFEMAELRILSAAMEAVVQIASAIVWSVFCAVAYTRLRGGREGLDAGRLVEVFA